ncbi:MAG: hypothetical protein MK110_14300 [Fuerstiella sp.]|nr:hypothetical protein [Fuerstiella sp.]
MNSSTRPPDANVSVRTAAETAGNTVATIGLILTLLAGLLCALLFVAATQLPEQNDSSRLSEGMPGDVRSGGGSGQDLRSTEVPEFNPEMDEQLAVHAELTRAALEGQRFQVLLLGIATFVLNLTGLVLCVIGLFVPNRPKTVAICGTVLSVLLFAGVFGVIAVGALLDPVTTAAG